MANQITTPPHDAESDIAAWVVGSGMMLIQASAVVIGLLPCLLLLLPLALPLLVVPILALPVALAVGLARLAARALRWLRGHAGSSNVAVTTPHVERSL